MKTYLLVLGLLDRLEVSLDEVFLLWCLISPKFGSFIPLVSYRILFVGSSSPSFLKSSPKNIYSYKNQILHLEKEAVIAYTNFAIFFNFLTLISKCK